MAFDSKKTILLEKTYLYVRASLGFQLEGTSTERIPTNNGFYRFFVDNLQKAIGNSYVNILYDSQDLTLQCFCSDLYMDELMSSDSSAIEDVVAELKKNTTTIVEFESGVSSAFESNHQDNVALNAKLTEFESGVSSALASNHEDNVSLHTLLTSLDKYLLGTGAFSKGPYAYPLEMLSNAITYLAQDVCINPSPSDFKKALNSNGNVVYQASYFVRCKNYLIVDFNVPKPIDYSIKYKIYFQAQCFDTSKSDSSSDIFRLNETLKEGLLNVRCSISYSAFTSYSVNVLLDSKSFEYLCSFSNCSSLSSCSFFDKTLIINDVFGHSVFNQRFNFDFDGGYLNLKFYSSLSPSELNTRTLRIYTDNGYYDFSCADLNFYNAPSGFKGMLLCSSSPQVGTSGSLKKLFGISIF